MICSKCGCEFDKKVKGMRCRACINQWHYNWKDKNKEKWNEIQRLNQIKIRSNDIEKHNKKQREYAKRKRQEKNIALGYDKDFNRAHLPKINDNQREINRVIINKHRSLRKRAGDASICAKVSELKGLVIEQGYVCHCCNMSLYGIQWCLDHKTPVHKGGLHQLNNIQFLCNNCHYIKTAHDMCGDKFNEHLNFYLKLHSV